jgi:hypothetical protein
LPIVTEAIAAATPRREPETSPDQNHVERGARPPLVETRAAIPSSAPPRLEVTTWNRSEIRGREGAAAAAEPPIHVTIGRIEVTSLTQAALAKRPGAPRKPALSLDDYLARRQGRQP